MKVKKIIITSVLAFLLVGLITYLILFAMTKADKKLRVFRDLNDEDVFRIESEICSKSEFVMLQNSNKRLYSEVFGEDCLTMNIGGVNLNDYIKDKTLNQLALYKAARLLANKKKIFLSDKEKDMIEKDAKAFVKNNQGLAYSGVKAYYEDLKIFDKVYETLTASVNSEISVDEARIISIQYIYVPKSAAGAFEKINSLYSSVTDKENPANFEKLAKETNNGEYACKLSRGITQKSFEDEAFLLATGEISPVITTDDAYYIVLCVNDYDKAATENNKIQILNNRKNVLFDSIYSEFIQSLYYEKNQKVLDSL
ncbi:MAG: peptidyl-prolyl cis-trans isomerase [Lachnospiraceae bacterium]|nr:peptidyl-prolyl cis-trans isomerase [Lachnospiraceae bacterium]